VNITAALAKGQLDLLFAVTEDGTSYPRLVVGPSAFGTVPTSADHLYASSLPLGPNAVVRVPASVLSSYIDPTTNSQVWYLGVVSSSTESYQVTIQASIEGYCPNSCSGHGTCKVVAPLYNAVCSCTGGWVGGACDVSADVTESSNVDTGLFVGLLFLFIAIGFVVGLGSSVLIKKCRESKQSSGGGGAAVVGGSYNTMND